MGGPNGEPGVVIVHVEACDHLHRILGKIRDLGGSPSVALSPHTPAEMVKNVLCDVDHVLVMTGTPASAARRTSPPCSTRSGASGAGSWRAATTWTSRSTVASRRTGPSPSAATPAPTASLPAAACSPTPPSRRGATLCAPWPRRPRPGTSWPSPTKRTRGRPNRVPARSTLERNLKKGFSPPSWRGAALKKKKKKKKKKIPPPPRGGGAPKKKKKKKKKKS